MKNLFVKPKPKKVLFSLIYMVLALVCLFLCVELGDSMKVLSMLTEDAKSSLGNLFLFAYFACSSMVGFMMIFVKEDEY